MELSIWYTVLNRSIAWDQMLPTPKSMAVEKVGLLNHGEDDGSREAVVASTASGGGHGEALTPSTAVEGCVGANHVDYNGIVA